MQFRLGRQPQPQCAGPLALRVLAIRDSLKDTLARKSAGQLVQLHEGWGKMEKAAEYKEQAAEGSVR